MGRAVMGKIIATSSGALAPGPNTFLVGPDAGCQLPAVAPAMSAASTSPTASLRPRLCADPMPVYGGRVIAESEEEYTSRHATIMNQGGGAASALEPGGHISRYRIVPGTAAHLPFQQAHPDEHQVLASVSVVNPPKQYSGLQDGAKLMRYPGANMDRPSSTGLRRSIREHGPVYVHAVLQGQMAQQASLRQGPHHQNQFVQVPRDVHDMMECCTVPLRNRSHACLVQGAHSLPTRDPRIPQHNRLLQNGSVLHQRPTQRELSMLKASERNAGHHEVIYSRQQQQRQQHMHPHHEGAYGCTDLLAMKQGAVPGHLVDHHPLPFPQGAAPKHLQRIGMTTGSAPGLSHIQLPEVHQIPTQTATFPVDHSTSIVRLRNASRDEGQLGNKLLHTTWGPVPRDGQEMGDKSWKTADSPRQGRDFPPVENYKAGGDQEENNKGSLLDLDHVLCENDEILRPFGDTVGTDDIFGEGFGLDGALPVSCAFASAQLSGVERKDDNPNENPSLIATAKLETEVPSSLHEACEGISGANFTQINCELKERNDQWGEALLDGSHEKLSGHMSCDNLLDSEEEDASPTISLGMNLEDMGQDHEMSMKGCTGEAYEEIFLEGEEDVEQEVSTEASGQAVSNDNTPNEEGGLGMESVNGSLGMKCPRVFSSLPSGRSRSGRNTAVQSNRSKSIRTSPGCQKSKSVKKKKSKSVATGTFMKKKLPFEIDDFLASAGLGFDSDEPNLLPKDPPRCPKKMVVKREDVVQLAISMTGRPTATLEEIQAACRWWLHESESDEGAASRGHVLRNWHGLKIASSFADGSKGLAAIQRCVENKECFIMCGVGTTGEASWGVKHMAEGGEDIEEQRSDSDEKTMYWTSEHDDCRVKEEGCCISASKVMEYRTSIYQKIAQEEHKRRQRLKDLQNNLEPKGFKGANTSIKSMHKAQKRAVVRSGGEDQQQTSWLLPGDTQSLNHSPKRRRTNQTAVSWCMNESGKHKTRSLSDVYAHGPKNLTGNDSSATLPDQELDSNACKVRLSAKSKNGMVDFHEQAAEKEGAGGGEWMGQSQNTCPAKMEVGQEFTGDGFQDKLSESEQGNLLDWLPDCECPWVFESSEVHTPSIASDRLQVEGLIQQQANGRLLDWKIEPQPAVVDEQGYC